MRKRNLQYVRTSQCKCKNEFEGDLAGAAKDYISEDNVPEEVIK